MLDATGAAAVMVGRGAQGRPWALREMAGERRRRRGRGEVVAELIRFMREVEREMGDRAVGFLRKFYGWYLRGAPGAKAIRGALVTCADRRRRRARAAASSAPRRAQLLAAHEAELELLPDSETDRLLELPISIYGGG